MRLASLGLWPQQPHMDNVMELSWVAGMVDPKVQFLLGLSHDAGHLAQIEEIVRQAKGNR